MAKNGGVPCPSFRFRAYAAPACPDFCPTYTPDGQTPDFAVVSEMCASRRDTSGHDDGATGRWHFPQPRYRRRRLANSVVLAPWDALGVHIQSVQAMARRHKQAITEPAAEAQVGAPLGQRDMADRRAVPVEYPHAVQIGVAHAP